jgi:hypothetical protein
MALLDNQSYKKKVSFVSSDNEDNKVIINLSVVCNHEIPKHILTSIEAPISGLFFSNYMALEAHKKNENEKQKQKLDAKKTLLMKKLNQ